ncbi:MAG: DUF2017 domain-containing protein [Trebonia sp.]|jgi:hypothetical protein|uniref:DUF2017 domain-containing protein n=1 Tax=Trebonia sp. TaxID=2767075 RepID=UPI002D937D5B|nr:DUF2017 domain-containing protein [Trebonia sp.]
MQMFRRTRDGGVSVWLPPGEATLLRTLVIPVLDLLGETGRPGEAGRPGAPGGTADDLDRLLAEAVEAAEAAEAPSIPDDPVLARLLPDAYQEDPEAAGEFRKYTESSLREAKKYFAQTLLDTLPPSGGRVRLTGDQARDWMRALNDVRLMFGVRLEVTEDFEEQLAALAPDDPKVAAFEVYGWLGAVQESLVRALDR